MKPLIALCSLVLAISLSVPLRAAQPPYERVLLPLAPGEVVGALGSRWLVEMIGYNRATVPVDVSDFPGSGCVAVGICEVERQSAFGSRTSRYRNPNEGSFIYVGAPGLGKVSFSLRVREMSRSAETWGVAIPVVRARDFFSGVLSLIDVPVSSGFRTSLRVYDHEGSSGAQVRIRIYKLEDATPLVDETVVLSRSPGTGFGDTPEVPASFMIADLASQYPVLASLPRSVRIEIEPVGTQTRIWAYASTTHNVTQWVTVMLPD